MTSMTLIFEDGKTGHECVNNTCVCTHVSESVGMKLKAELLLLLAGNRSSWTGPEGRMQG